MDLLVGVSDARAQALKNLQRPIPVPIHVRGLVDTGASCTAIDVDVIKALGITPTGRTSVLTPSTGAKPHECNQYDCGITLLHTTTQLNLSPIAAIESRLSHQGFHVLIGRDILRNCLFFYNGAVSRFALAF